MSIAIDLIQFVLMAYLFYMTCGLAFRIHDLENEMYIRASELPRPTTLDIEPAQSDIDEAAKWHASMPAADPRR